jgi:hypothetical protein
MEESKATKHKDVREIIEEVYYRGSDDLPIEDVLSYARIALAELVEGMKLTVKLCGKGYESCAVCSHSECDCKRHYFQALTDISSLFRGRVE